MPTPGYCGSLSFQVLVWNTVMGLTFGMFVHTWYYLVIPDMLAILIAYGITAVLLLLSPLMTCFADWGNVRGVCVTLGLLLSILFFFLTPLFLCLLLTLPVLYTAFNASVIQYGVSQLSDQSSENLSIFIHWFVWTHYLGVCVCRISWSVFVCASGGPSITGICLLCVIPCLSLAALVVFVCMYCFANVHTGCPIDVPDEDMEDPCNALSYCCGCEQSFYDKYCRINFNSRKDVNMKSFLKALLVVVVISPVFYMELATDGLFPVLGIHTQGDWTFMSDHPRCNSAKNVIINSGALAPMLIVAIIPLFMLVRRYISHWIPGKLTRIGLGMVILLLSIASNFTIDTIGHFNNKNATCMFTANYLDDNGSNPDLRLNIDSGYLIIPNVLNSIGLMLVYIASYEFICSRSSGSMQGVLIGVFFGLKGLSQLVGVEVIVLLISKYWKPQFPSCGFGYYLLNIAMAIIGIVIYTLVAGIYRYNLTEADEVESLDKERRALLRSREIISIRPREIIPRRPINYNLHMMPQRIIPQGTTIALCQNGSKEFARIRKKFTKDWSTKKGTCPMVTHVFTVTNPDLEKTWTAYKRCLRNKIVETYYHGTNLKCDIASTQQLCTNAECGICGISCEGLNPNYIRKGFSFQRFGQGFYLAPHSSKCHDYTKSSNRYTAILKCDVLPGKKYKLKENDQSLRGPPPGYNCVYGKIGQDLNYPEIVLYEKDAVMPRFIIVYMPV